MVIFRENTEDIYAGIDFQAGGEAATKTLEFLAQNFPKEFKKIRFGGEAPELVGIGIKPVSKPGTERLVRSAHPVRHRAKAQEPHDCSQGQHHEIYRGRIPRLGVRTREDANLAQWKLTAARGAKSPRGKPGAGLVIKDSIADIALQQVLTRPTDFDVIATLNLNGDYLSDALAAQVGGIGIAPGGNINYLTGHAIFEATHGTAPKYAEQGSSEPRQRRPQRRNDVPLPRLERSRGPHHQRHQRRDRQQAA